MMQTYEKPLPAVDPDSQPFWQSLEEGRLSIQRCKACGAYRWPARAICNRCFSLDSEWSEVSGRGTVVSWVRTWKVFTASFKDDVPYFTITVRLTEQDDIHMIGQFADPKTEPTKNMPVRAVIRRVTDDQPLLFWEPAT
jgi:uncharacterized OB-fold protein